MASYEPTDPYGQHGQPWNPQQPYGRPIDPNAPYGYDPYGSPWSDKSKVVAGLLQLLPGVFFGLGGIGRLYAGNTSLGILQIVATVVGWISFFCGFLFLLPFVIFAVVWLWFVIDGIMLLVGNPRDGQNRLLRA